MGTICVLLISSILVYVTAMLAIPFTYQKNVSVQFENNSAEFSQKLNKWTVNEAEDRIYNFCIDNGVIVIQQIKHCLFRHIKTGLL